MLLLAGGLEADPASSGFFGGGVMLLVAGVWFISRWLKRPEQTTHPGRGLVDHRAPRLSQRDLPSRPNRPLHHADRVGGIHHRRCRLVPPLRRPAADRKSGTGGYPLLAESLLPVVHDPNTTEGRESLNLTPTKQR